jgi:hypothetical protein
MRTDITDTETGVVTVIKVLSSGAAFAVLPETGEEMFITSRIADTASVKLGGTYFAQFLPNVRVERTKWFAVWLGPDPRQIDEEELRDQLVEILWRTDIATDDGLDELVAFMKKLGVRVTRKVEESDDV